MADGFVFYKSFMDALEFVPEEDKLDCLTSLMNYALLGEASPETNSGRMFLTLVKPQIDANTKRREAGKKGAEFGVLGGRPKKETTQEKTENPIGVINENPTEEKHETPKVKEKVKEKVIDISSEPSPKSAEPELELADVAAIILADGTEWRPTKAMYDTFVQAFPGVDVKAEFIKMRAWCDANPKNRKTWAGASRFANSWLSREQDRPKPKPVKRSQYDTAALEAALAWK